MSSDDKKAGGRRGAGRGRRQTPAQEPPIPSRGIPESPMAPSVPGEIAGGRGRGRAVVTEPQIAPSEGSPEAGSPKGSPSGSDVDDKMKNLEIIGLAPRPGFGVSGNKTQVLANYFEVAMQKELTVTQYRVEVKHERMKLNRDEKQRIFWTCVRENPTVFQNHTRLVYDGESICASLDRLTFGNGPGSDVGGTYEIRIRLNRMDRPEPMKVIFSGTGLIHLNMREVRSAGGTGDRYTTPLQVFDLIMRQRRTYLLDEVTAREWFTFANTVYKIPPGGRGPDLTCGRVIWQGLFSAARVGQGYTPYINFDVSHSGFYKPQSVLEYMVDILNATQVNPRDRHATMFNVNQLDQNTSLQQHWLLPVDKGMRGLKVRMQVRKVDGELMEREYTVNNVVKDTATTHSFPQRQPDGTERSITVATYFAERYGPLRYPNLQLLHVGPRNKKCYVPMEHCTLAYNQRVRKLNPTETSIMIKAAAIDAPTRKGKINDLVKQSNFVQDAWLQQFGVRVNTEMKKVDARVLQPPKIQYAQGGGGGRQGPIAEVRDGKWDMRGQKFYLGASCNKIAALITEDRDIPAYMDFFGFLLQTCREFGMNVPANIHQSAVLTVPTNNIGAIEESLTRLKNMGAEFVIVTLPQKGCPHYNEVKRVAEIVLGLMTQCVVKGNIMKCMQKRDRMTTGNIALKMNMKMGGVNSKAQADDLARRTLLEVPTLVLGIDVTHPSATEKKMPSISSVVGNVDDSFMRFGASVRIQKHRRESIVAGHLDQLVRDRLVEYHKYVSQENAKNKESKKSQPERVIIYRDGVAEGQFQEVLREELGGVREACRALRADYRPKLTLIIAQKRHHTRFFPTVQGQGSGKADNIWPGTVIDRDITHPEQFEFYMCSHHGIQGTSRPIRYHVLHDDNNFSADHIQAMTFYLCHVYARCTRAVSIPAPIYYADLACRRARGHIFDKVSDFSSDTMSQRSGSGGETETAVSEDELIRSSTVHDALHMKMYFT